jgi:hypothetical protein
MSEIYIALDSARHRASHDFFTTGNGSFEERLNLIYNASKHALAGAELPVWFTDDGLTSSAAKLAFSEVEDFMVKMATTVKGLCSREVALKALHP